MIILFILAAALVGLILLVLILVRRDKDIFNLNNQNK